MTVTRPRPGRAGRTEKVSISFDRSDLKLLRARARRLYGGNLSAVVTEGVRRIRDEEGRQALVAWLGEAADAEPADLEAILGEWRAHVVRHGRRHGK